MGRNWVRGALGGGAEASENVRMEGAPTCNLHNASVRIITLHQFLGIENKSIYLTELGFSEHLF